MVNQEETTFVGFLSSDTVRIFLRVTQFRERELVVSFIYLGNLGNPRSPCFGNNIHFA